MAFALTKFRAYGVEIDEPITTRFKQYAHLTITGLNTDTALDMGNLTGTFWTAVSGTAPGINALAAFGSIQSAASTFVSVGGTGLSGKALQSTTAQNITTTLTSAASVGGSVSEVYVVTGLLATDTILAVTPVVATATGRASIINLSGTVASGSATPAITVAGLTTSGNGDTILAVTQTTKGANSLPLLGWNTQTAGALVGVYSADPGASAVVNVAVKRVATADTYLPISWGTQAANALTVVYGADPGAGAKVLVSVQRVSTAVVTGDYQLAMDGTNTNLPSLTFLSGGAPTTYSIVLSWELLSGAAPINVVG